MDDPLTFFHVAIAEVRAMIKAGVIRNPPHAALQFNTVIEEPPHTEPCGHCGGPVVIAYKDYPHYTNYTGGKTVACPGCGKQSEFQLNADRAPGSSRDPIWRLRPVQPPPVKG